MRKYLTLRNILLCSGAFIAFVFFFLSFAVKAEITSTEADFSYVFNNSVWGSTSVTTVAQGGNVTMTDPIPADQRAVSALPLLGFIFLLVGALGAPVCAFFINNEKARLVCILSCGFLAVLGGVFQFFGGDSALQQYAKSSGITPAQAQTLLEAFHAKTSPGAMGIVCGVFGIISGLTMGCSQFVPDKKF